MRSDIAAPGIVLGVGLGGFVDGILLHQVLQWHHMLTSTDTDRIGLRYYPADTVAGLRMNTLWDGVFHTVTWLAVLIGLGMLYSRITTGRARLWGSRALWGWILVGWGLFNLVEGLVDHQILGIHHVRSGPHQLWWDMGFLALGAVLAGAGRLLARGATVHGGATGGVNHDHAAGAGPLALAVLAVAAGYEALTVLDRLGRAWPWPRTLLFLAGCTLLATGLDPAASPWPPGDLRTHMLQHLLTAMLAPLALVLGAPVTLLLRTLPRPAARGLGRLLRAGPVRLVTRPWVALGLNAGGLLVVYCTPLYTATLSGPGLHLLVHAHFVLSGALFAWVVAGPDPAPHRPPVPARLVVLGAAVAVHAVLAQLMYAGLLVDLPVPPEQRRGAAELMYYAGDIAELLVAFALVTTWRPARPGARAGRRPGTLYTRRVLTMDRLKVGYGDRIVIEELSLTIDPGEGVALRGPNGIGKSTVLRCVAGLLEPADGSVLVGGAPVDERRAEFRRAVAALLDPPAWYPGLSAREHLSLVRLANAPVGADWFADGELAGRLGVDDFADASPSSLSSGQRQRLALAMVLDRPSRLLLLDEPERHLDREGRDTVAALIGEYLARGGAALLASHDPTVTAGCEVIELGHDWYEEDGELGDDPAGEAPE